MKKYDFDLGILKGNVYTEGVFTEDQIKGYIELKREEVSRLNNSTHPVEFDMYYSV